MIPAPWSAAARACFSCWSTIEAVSPVHFAWTSAARTMLDMAAPLRSATPPQTMFGGRPRRAGRPVNRRYDQSPPRAMITRSPSVPFRVGGNHRTARACEDAGRTPAPRRSNSFEQAKHRLVGHSADSPRHEPVSSGPARTTAIRERRGRPATPHQRLTQTRCGSLDVSSRARSWAARSRTSSYEVGAMRSPSSSCTAVVILDSPRLR